MRATKEVLGKPGRVLSATKIRNIMHKVKPQKGYQSGQHDVGNFIRDFLKVLNDEFLDNEIGDIFLAIIGQNFLCENCGNKTDNTASLYASTAYS